MVHVVANFGATILPALLSSSSVFTQHQSTPIIQKVAKKSIVGKKMH
jgi:hypothetical protein